MNSIENRLKEVIEDMEKVYDEKLSEQIKKEKEEIIKNLFNMFPHLESRKEEIITECFEKKEGPQEEKVKKVVPKKYEKVEEMVFDQITHNGNAYYLNDNKGIWDENGKLIGSLIGYDDNNEPIISFFNDSLKKNLKLPFKMDQQ